MNGFGKWLRQIGARCTAALRRFATGRYGTDQLGMTMLCVSLVLTLITTFIDAPIAWGIVISISYALMILAIVRILSRNTYKRYEENRRFLRLLDRFKDRDHRYFNCPRCHQRVRVPRGKGKISITCPKCKEKFVKKT